MHKDLDTVAILKLQIAGAHSHLTDNTQSDWDPSAIELLMGLDLNKCMSFPIALCNYLMCKDHFLKCMGKTNMRI